MAINLIQQCSIFLAGGCTCLSQYCAKGFTDRRFLLTVIDLQYIHLFSEIVYNFLALAVHLQYSIKVDETSPFLRIFDFDSLLH